MKSTALILFFSCMGAAIGQSISLHLKDISTSYRSIDFTDESGTVKPFNLVSSEATGDNIQVVAGKVNADVKVGFIVKKVVIPKPPAKTQIVAELQQNCAEALQPCIEALADDATKFKMIMYGVAEESKQLKCTGGANPPTVTLIHSGVPAAGQIRVTAGDISEKDFTLGAGVTECSIDQSTPPEMLTISEAKGCSEESANCYENNLAQETLFKWGMFVLCLAAAKML